MTKAGGLSAAKHSAIECIHKKYKYNVVDIFGQVGCGKLERIMRTKFVS